MHSTPKVLRAYDEAYVIKRKEEDRIAWLQWGNYGVSALVFAIDHCLNGQKARSKYSEKPMMKEIEENNKPLTEEEIKRQRELFVAKLEIMKTNFELNHKKKVEEC